MIFDPFKHLSYYQTSQLLSSSMCFFQRKCYSISTPAAPLGMYQHSNATSFTELAGACTWPEGSGGLCFSPHRVVGELGVQYGASDKEPTCQCGRHKRLGFKEPTCQCRRHKRLGFDPWVWTTPWRREWQTPHSSILAWRIPWTEEPGGLQSTGLQRTGHDWSQGAHTELGLGTGRPGLLAWRIPGMGEPGRSMGSHRVGHDWSNLAAAAAADPGWDQELSSVRPLLGVLMAFRVVPV